MRDSLIKEQEMCDKFLREMYNQGNGNTFLVFTPLHYQVKQSSRGWQGTIWHLGCFHVLAIANNIAMNIRVHVSFLIYNFVLIYAQAFPGGASGKEPACQCRRHEMWVQFLGRSPGGWIGSLLQCSCLENPTDRGVCRASLWGHKESDTTEVT